MIKRTIIVRLLGLAMSAWAVTASAQPVSPYAGQEGREIKAPERKPQGKVIDLMEALRQSAAATDAGGKKSGGKKASSSKRSAKGGQAEQRKKAS